jgi:hypothetical protein
MKILKLITHNLVVYNNKKLCHHVKHNLFYFWLEYESIWTNIDILLFHFFLSNYVDGPNHKHCLRTLKDIF